MNKLALLQQQAINSAKKEDWPKAVEVNTSILEFNPNDTGALNRLAAAHLQLGQKKPAQNYLEQVLKIDKTNSIALKHLACLKSKTKVNAPSFSKEHFIEEPGITKVVDLHRLAGKKVLENLKMGDECTLMIKNRYISVESENLYIGALPEDLSFRLSKLIKNGNKYLCFIHNANCKNCTVYLKEIYRSKKNSHVNSFPTSKANLNSINDLDEQFMVEEDVPLNIVETDNDEEETPAVNTKTTLTI